MFDRLPLKLSTAKLGIRVDCQNHMSLIGLLDIDNDTDPPGKKEHLGVYISKDMTYTRIDMPKYINIDQDQVVSELDYD